MTIELVKTLKNEPGIVFFLYEGERLERHSFWGFLPKTDQEYLKSLTEKLVVKNRTHVLLLPSGRRAIVIGQPKRNAMSHRKAFLFVRQVIVTAKREGIKNIAIDSEDFEIGHEKWKPENVLEFIGIQSELASFDFTKYKEAPSDGFPKVEKVYVFRNKISAGLLSALKRGKIIGEEINKARALSNTPGSDMTPASLAKAAVDSGKESGFTVKVLEEAEIKKLGMGGVLGVAQGSSEKPRFIVMEYLKGKKKEKPVVLVGKGVTFDTGGLNLKPSSFIYEMHMDMSGGAAVMHTIAALARLKVKKNIVGLVPAVENMPSGSSYHPGDVLKTMSGKTIEVLDTDAEGRVILADGLAYAQKFYDPRLIIDIATLTGAAMVALGSRASAMFVTDPRLESPLRRIAEETGDFVWPLPLWEEYEEEIKGTFGDVANVGKTRYGGAITAAVFLWQFVKGRKWVHLDIAPRMTTTDGEFLAKGAAGASINLLTRFLSKF